MIWDKDDGPFLRDVFCPFVCLGYSLHEMHGVEHIH